MARVHPRVHTHRERCPTPGRARGLPIAEREKPGGGGISTPGSEPQRSLALPSLLDVCFTSSVPLLHLAFLLSSQPPAPPSPRPPFAPQLSPPRADSSLLLRHPFSYLYLTLSRLPVLTQHPRSHPHRPAGSPLGFLSPSDVSSPPRSDPPPLAVARPL